MQHLRLIIAIFISGIFDKALTAVIQTQQTVLAAVGEDAEFSCQLLEAKDVLQVTWQKISGDGGENVATYNKYFGQRVNDGFTDKFKFKYTGLQNCSIVIRNVVEQDEACYHCLFNTYPEGSFIGKPCLQVYELHEPVLDVRESNSPAEWVVSCSATGRPAPTVTLSVSQHHLNFSQYNTVSVSNTNATFTVTTTAVLSGSRRNSTQVGCAARVLSAPQIEVIQVIPEDDDDDGLDEKSGSNHRSLGIRILVILSSVLLVVCVAALMFVLHRQKSQSSLAHRELQMNETMSRDTQEIVTPPVNRSENQLKKRTPPESHQPNHDPGLSPSPTQRLTFK
ncbi:OX-2 membrane glycoprotein-like isoform X2 [Archocentrus centrarchus]|uniref:OX-2 membrane glycoprotein-like isoform X2 n=1 Tax=Archocentrus centrarchus TaxID=63155 RepID=UPI0011EA36F7|nr:OX-2 membrane glycoprotein-like isoform X2 [Archocentrus centrarchus]